MELYFYPEKTEEVVKGCARGNEGEGNLFKLTEIVKHLKDDIEKSGLPKWEVALKGYIEVSSGGILPGGKNGFEATITLKSP
jgi:hypothetical protein